MLSSSYFDNPPLVVALAMFVGVAAQVVARHVKVPGIVLLLGAGVLLGPDGLDVVRPEALGAGLEGLVGFSVALILFDGALNLDVRTLRRQQLPIRRLVLVGSWMTAAGAALSAHLGLGWDWRRALLFGTLVIVTGPTVITPLLRAIRARPSVETVLEAEGVFIDAMGATIAVVALEIALAPTGRHFSVALLGVGERLGLGIVVGAVAGTGFAILMRFREALPEGLANVAALAMTVFIFAASNAVYPESGIAAVIAAGMVIGNTKAHDLGDLKAFKAQLTSLLVATLFVLLAADVRLRDVRALGVGGVVTVLALTLAVRPVVVLVCTAGSALEPKEKLFLSWVAPRGIVAAAMSSMFAERMSRAGVEGGDALRALVFLVIASTVVFQGMSAGFVAKLLGLRQTRNDGYALLGADPLARCLGAALGVTGEEIILIDKDPNSAQEAEAEGFRVVFGDGLDERSFIKARASGRRACVGATSNESVNFLFAKMAREHARTVETYVAIDRIEGGITADMVEQGRSEVLFAGTRELAVWRTHAAKKRLSLRPFLATDATRNEPSFAELPRSSALPLAFIRKGVAAPVERSYRARAGDVVQIAVLGDEAEIATKWLEEHGFEPAQGNA